MSDALPCSRLLGEMHMALLRLLQADMEEAHAAAGHMGAAGAADKAISHSAACLEEAWAWGFDVDVWRAHLNALTWPEVSNYEQPPRLCYTLSIILGMRCTQVVSRCLHCTVSAV